MTESDRDPFDDRRAHARYSPDPWLPILFRSPRSELQCAGHIVDLSEGGAKIVAPPSCPAPLAWGDSFEITLAYSESARRFGFEGLDLEAVVVRVLSDARAYTVHAMFRHRQLHDRLNDYLAMLAQHALVSHSDTVSIPPRR